MRNSTQIELAYKKWKVDFENLLDEINLCMERFDQTKHCKCSIDECKHFERERDMIFGKRIDYLFNLCLENGFQTFSEMTKSV
jgi:hypothetical protein